MASVNDRPLEFGFYQSNARFKFIHNLTFKWKKYLLPMSVAFALTYNLPKYFEMKIETADNVTTIVPTGEKCYRHFKRRNVRLRDPASSRNPAMAFFLTCLTHLLANLGWVDFDLGCSTILPNAPVHV